MGAKFFLRSYNYNFGSRDWLWCSSPDRAKHVPFSTESRLAAETTQPPVLNCYAMKTKGRSGYIDPYFIDLDTG